MQVLRNKVHSVLDLEAGDNQILGDIILLLAQLLEDVNLHILSFYDWGYYLCNLSIIK
jgi:hypothetical protein